MKQRMPNDQASGMRMHGNDYIDVITEDAEAVPVGAQGQHRPRHTIDGIDVAPQVVLMDACAHRDTSAKRAQHDQRAMRHFRC